LIEDARRKMAKKSIRVGGGKEDGPEAFIFYVCEVPAIFFWDSFASQGSPSWASTPRFQKHDFFLINYFRRGVLANHSNHDVISASLARLGVLNPNGKRRLRSSFGRAEKASNADWPVLLSYFPSWQVHKYPVDLPAPRLVGVGIKSHNFFFFFLFFPYSF